MAQARIGWTTQNQPGPARGVARKTRRRALTAIAALLMAVGLALLVAAFALLLRNRGGDSSVGLAPSTVLAREIQDAGLGCEDFRIHVRRGTGVTGEGSCTSEVGPLRIVIYRTPSARTYAENLTRGYVCQGLAARGMTQIGTVVGDVSGGVTRAWAIEPATSDPAAAQTIGDAIGGQVTNFDCATFFAPPPPAPAPAPAPEPAPEPPPA